MKEKRIIYALLLALFFLPAGATFIHFKIHSGIVWLPYLTLFDAIVVTLMFKSRKTAVYALFLNSIFVIIGIGFHLKFLPGGWADIMMSLTDFFTGYAVYGLVTKN
ncbi:MAG: hypothetical protein KJI70_01360 [Patescibacteria group bacterium]|nr:hypothetical protein [Patescibacteria group bacterium]